MYAFLEGTLQENEPLVVLDVGGIGYELHVGERQRRALPPLGERVRLHTHLVVREDDLTLYGFAVAEEREVFRALLSVNGVGPKVALSVVGSEQAPEVLRGIRAGDSRPLLAVKGIGKKTAERVVLELRDSAAAWALIGPAPEAGAARAAEEELDGPAAEAVLALQSLGVSPERAAAAVAGVVGESPAVSVEEVLRQALRRLHPESRTR